MKPVQVDWLNAAGQLCSTLAWLVQEDFATVTLASSFEGTDSLSAEAEGFVMSREHIVDIQVLTLVPRHLQAPVPVSH